MSWQKQKTKIVTTVIIVTMLLPVLFSLPTTPAGSASPPKLTTNNPPAIYGTLADLWAGNAYFEKESYTVQFSSNPVHEVAPIARPDIGPNVIFLYYRTYINSLGQPFSNGQDGIGLARSYDGGASFGLYNNGAAVLGPGSNCEFDSKEVIAPSVVQVGATFYMVYEASAPNGCSPGYPGDIGLATSTDGISWQKGGMIVQHQTTIGWQSANVGTPFIGYYNVGGSYQFYVFFHGHSGGTYSKIGFASGTDLHNLVQNGGGLSAVIDPVQYGGLKSWDNQVVSRASIVFESPYYYITFEGSGDAHCNTPNANWGWGIARSTDLVNWDMYPYNPIRQQYQSSDCGNDLPYIFQFNGVTTVYQAGNTNCCPSPQAGPSNVLLKGTTTTLPNTALVKPGGDQYLFVSQASSQCATWHRVGRLDGDGWSANVHDDTSENYLCYGPYVSALPAGKYATNFREMVDTINCGVFCSFDNVITLDFYDHTTNSQFNVADVHRSDFTRAGVYQNEESQFTASANHQYEWRTWWHHNSYVKQQWVAARWLDGVYDQTPPTTSINSPSTGTSSGFTVSWSGSDTQSGIWSYDLQYQDNGGSWTDWWISTPGQACCVGTMQTSAQYLGQCFHTYGFHVRARDNAGNVGSWSSTTSTYIGCDFAVSANPTSITTAPSSTASSTVSVVSTGGSRWPYTVTLSISISPGTGLTCSLSSIYVVPDSTPSTLSCSGSLGTYSVTVTGTSGSTSHPVTVNYIITNPATTLSNNPFSSDWTILSGTWSQVAGNLDGSGNYPEIKSTATFPADRTVTASMRTTNPGGSNWQVAWLRGKYLDNNNKLMMYLRTDGYLEIDVLRAGTACSNWCYYASTLSTGQVPTAWHTFQMVFAGNQIKGLLDNVVYLDITNPVFGTFGTSNVVLYSQLNMESQWNAVTIASGGGGGGTVLSNNPSSADWVTVCGCGSWTQVSGYVDGQNAWAELKSSATFASDRTVTLRMLSITTGSQLYNAAWVRPKYIDNNNEVMLLMHTDGALELSIVYQGTQRTLAQVSTGLSPTAWHTFKTTIAGNTLNVWVDGTQYMTNVIDPNGQVNALGATSVALMNGGNTHSQFDSVTIS